MFFCILVVYIKFRTFSKKRWPLYLMYFRNYGLRKTCLDIWLKSAVSDDPFIGNMVNVPKQCFNLNDSTVTIFSDDFERTWFRKSLF